MELKKSEKANLENKKVLFVEIGLIVAISVMIFAFEYRSYDKSDVEQVVKRDDIAIESIDIPQTETNVPPPEDIPPAEPTEFEIVADNVNIDNSFDLTSLFSDKNNTTGIKLDKREIKNDEETFKEEEIFIVVEQQAEFPLPEGLDNYLNKNIAYPESARKAGIEGTVAVQFVVEKDGSLTNIKIMRDIGGGCGEEVIRIFKAMPPWKPAMQRGKPVRNQFGKNVKFSLSSN